MEAVLQFIKAQLDDRVLLDLFLKTLTVNISKDVVQHNPISEEDAIIKAQQLELIYTQSGYIYNILPIAPCLQYYKEFLGASNSIDELIESMTQGYLGSSSQNPSYTHGSTQNIPQPGFQSHHRQQQNLTNMVSACHQGGPYPSAEET